MYFTKEEVKFFTSGAAILDGVLGGGWAQNRMLNIVGDKSTGKTLLSLEAAANFLRVNTEGIVKFADVESAFNLEYMRGLGIPLESIQFPEDIYTVEDWYMQLDGFITELSDTNKPGMFILDSLDALSDQAELEREITEGTYGGTKPKQVSTFFRKLNSRIAHQNITLVIISQIRDVLNSRFPMKMRAGGRAMDFYASQVLWLSENGKLKRTVQGIEEIVGLSVASNCKKNKVGMPFRECNFNIVFGYGIDDVSSNLEFLSDKKIVPLGGLDKIPLIGKYKIEDEKQITTYSKKFMELEPEERLSIRKQISEITTDIWNQKEALFRTEATKY